MTTHTTPTEQTEALARVVAYLDGLDGFYGDDEKPDDVLDYVDGGPTSPPLLLSDLRILAARGGNTDNTLRDRLAGVVAKFERHADYLEGLGNENADDHAEVLRVEYLPEFRELLDAAPAPTEIDCTGNALGLNCSCDTANDCPMSAPTDNQHNNGLADRVAAEVSRLRAKAAEAEQYGWTAEDYSDLIDGTVRRLRAVVDGPTNTNQEDQ